MPLIRSQVRHLMYVWCVVPGGAGERKTQSTGARAGVRCLPDATSAVLAKPQMKLLEASEVKHLEVRVGPNRASVVRVEATEPDGEGCIKAVSRFSVPD